MIDSNSINIDEGKKSILIGKKNYQFLVTLTGVLSVILLIWNILTRNTEVMSVNKLGKIV